MIAFLRDNARWLGAGFLLTLAGSFGQTWFISLFAGEIRAVHGLSDGQWGSLYTVATLASAALLFLRGALADTVRPGMLAPLIALAFAAACLGLAFAPNVAVLGLALFGLRFCGQGMFGHIALTAMGRWFRATRGRAVAIAAFGHSAGEVIWPLPAILLAGLLGWQAVWIGVAALLALGVAPVIARLLAKGRVPQGADTAEAGQAGIGGRHWTRRDVLGHGLFLALLPILLTPGFIGTVVFFHQVHVAGVKGWTLAQMAPGYAAFAALTVLSSFAAGWAADRFGPARLLPVLLLPMGAGIALLGPVSAVSGWFVVLGLIGLTQGMTGALWGTLLPAIYGTQHLGAVRSLATTVMVVSTAIGPGMTGLLIDSGVTFPRQGLALGLWCFGLSGLGWVISRRIVGAMTHEAA